LAVTKEDTQLNLLQEVVQGHHSTLDECLESIECLEHWIAVQEAEGSPSRLAEVGTHEGLCRGVIIRQHQLCPV
jgi:hypothetical protein